MDRRVCDAGLVTYRSRGWMDGRLRSWALADSTSLGVVCAERLGVKLSIGAKPAPGMNFFSVTYSRGGAV